ncbi:porin family protein [Hymenobacter sp. CRA2]|uniref:porin family protein n=1 Tax=Hymenobacter sp. CRA2 TaxID=1955620 RepID=UPI00098F6E5F|nr:porin family protein [Hymenobacter sp. CRA2]OON70530.1 hypothetical protein B0919_00430 [Hymenobacter sp. CRA2]
MKKVFFALAIAIGVSSAAQAQVTLGIKAGASLANYNGDDWKDMDSKGLVGFHGGVTLNAPITSDGFFSIQPELLYSQKGWRLEEDGEKFTSRVHNIDLPILARINADGFIFEAGPQIGFLAGATTKYEGSLGEAKDSDTDGYNKLDFGYVAGVGYQFSSGPNLGIRYNGGISGVFEKVDGESLKVHNSVFQFYVGYTFKK